MKVMGIRKKMLIFSWKSSINIYNYDGKGDSITYQVKIAVHEKGGGFRIIILLVVCSL